MCVGVRFVCLPFLLPRFQPLCIESFAAFFVCLPFLGAMIQWLNGTELTNIFW